MSEQRKEREKIEIKGNENEGLFTNQQLNINYQEKGEINKGLENDEINFDSINFNINPFNSEDNSKRENNYFNNNIFMKEMEPKDNKNQILETNKITIPNNFNPSLKLNKNNTQLEQLLLSNNNNINLNNQGNFSNNMNNMNNINNFSTNNISQPIPPFFKNINTPERNDFLLMDNYKYIPNNPNINYIDNRANANLISLTPNTNIYNQINDNSMQINSYNEQMNNNINNLINNDFNNYIQRTNQISWVCPFCYNFNSQMENICRRCGKINNNVIQTNNSSFYLNNLPLLFRKDNTVFPFSNINNSNSLYYNNNASSNFVNSNINNISNRNIYHNNYICCQNNQNDEENILSKIPKTKKGKKAQKKLIQKYKNKRPYDWICKRCLNLNYSFRSFCNICKLPLKDNLNYQKNI